MTLHKLSAADRPGQFGPVRIVRLFAIAASCALVGCAAAASEDSAQNGIGTESFDALGEQLTGQVCASECHGWDQVFAGPRQVAGRWDYIVAEMVGRGATASDEQLAIVRRWLKHTWGTVSINSASAQEIVSVLALPEDVAKAVVAWRNAHGRFGSLDNLKEVPGIDPSALDAQADAIAFD